MTNYEDLQGTWVIDPAHSSFNFMARHAMVTKVRGKFDEIEGTINIDGANPDASSATASAKAASINTGNAMRDEHLRAGDFLEVDAYPTLSFKSTGAKVSDGEVTITGELTIKDVTKEISFDLDGVGPAKDHMGNERLGFEGKFDINRTDYGVNFNAALEAGGVLVSDKVTVTLDISAVRA